MLVLGIRPAATPSARPRNSIQLSVFPLTQTHLVQLSCPNTSSWKYKSNSILVHHNKTKVDRWWFQRGKKRNNFRNRNNFDHTSSSVYGFVSRDNKKGNLFYHKSHTKNEWIINWTPETFSIFSWKYPPTLKPSDADWVLAFYKVPTATRPLNQQWLYNAIQSRWFHSYFS